MTESKASSHSSETIQDPKLDQSPTLSSIEKGEINDAPFMSSENKGDKDEEKDKKSKKEKKEKKPSVSIHQLFRFATPIERVMIVIALIFSVGVGAMQPMTIVILGSFLNTLGSVLSGGDTSNMLDSTMSLILTFVYMGIAVLVAAYTANCFWVLTGENQTRRIRQLYVHSILRQQMSWHDMKEHESLNTRLAGDTQLIQDGISEKFGLFAAAIGQFLSGFIIAFVKGWNLAVVMLATMPLLAGTGAAMGYFKNKYTLEGRNSYSSAGSVAEQVFAGIRTVYSFSLQERFSEQYNKQLAEARAKGVKGGITLGLGFGSFMLILFCTYGLAFWYGSQLVLQGKFNGSNVIVVFFAMVMGAFAILNLPANLSAVSSACGAAYTIFNTIDRIPDIDPDSTTGQQLDSIQGDIEFSNIKFNYPTRPDVPILKDLSLKIKPGMTVAFVGPSGSGKSTVIQLLQRFYDPLEGKVLIDGHDVKSLNVGWLRSQIGVVSQEPVLFNTSIKKNLLMGVANPNEVTDDQIIEACKKANCHMFISEMPKGYETMVGEHGGMLSGGQKQRVAIARAILKNPNILLLDEATSALDTQSERLVQKALDAASVDRTTIVVAHRLSTIRNADLIVVMQSGDLIEQGTHNELLELGGVYSELVKKQQIALKQEDSESAEVDEEALVRQEAEELRQEQQEKDFEVFVEKEPTNLMKTVSRTSVDAHVEKLRKEKLEKKEAMKKKAPIGKVLRDMRPEWPLMGTGVIGAAVAGAVFPCFALIFAQITVILVNTPVSEMSPGPMEGANLYAFLFVIIGIAAFLGFSTQVISFEVAGERYTERLRGKVFRTFMKQEIGYFDEEDHSMGALTTKLEVDAKNVNELVTKTWGDITQIIVTAITGLVIAFTHSWALTLVILGMAPFIIGATAHESKIHRGFEDKTKKANAQSGEVAGEAIKEIRTVAGLNKQNEFENRFSAALERPHRLATNKAYLASIGYALHQGIPLFTNAVAFYAGVRFMMLGMITFQEMFTTMMAIIITAQGVGRASVFTSTFAKAKYSAVAIFELLERTPSIDPDDEGIEAQRGNVNGDIDFKNISFRYPARPDIGIFNGEFNLVGKANTTIALVGPSGCGKSTTIGMLQRWYDPLSGSVRLDDHNVKEYTVGNLRSHMALVGQEPVLFDLTIGENIRFGVDDSEKVTQEMVEKACRDANIHNFIVSLPDGYDTRVGDKGSQLSGGQKQRISIARALIRKPRVLLLDEATSALDSESEKLVQKAIDNILEEGGRTTITIAHRLSTIQKADLICVIKNGRVIEQGTHWDLLKLNGAYSELVHQQSLNAN